MTWGLENVRVGFGRRIALDGVTVPAGPASVTVVVGGDGAGKSTCLKTLVGLVRPQAGSVRRPAKERIGYVPATAGLYADLTVQQNLDFSAGAYRLPAGQREQREQQLLERTGLAGVPPAARRAAFRRHAAQAGRGAGAAARAGPAGAG